MVGPVSELKYRSLEARIMCECVAFTKDLRKTWRGGSGVMFRCFFFTFVGSVFVCVRVVFAFVCGVATI